MLCISCNTKPVKLPRKKLCIPCYRKEWWSSNPTHSRELHRRYDSSEKGLARRRANGKIYRAKHKDKISARAKLLWALKTGKISKLPCYVCKNSSYVEAHHPNYNQPLTVLWFCLRHHREIHGQIMYPN